MSALFQIELNRFPFQPSPFVIQFVILFSSIFLIVALPGRVGQQRRFDPVERNKRIHQPVVQSQHKRAHFGRHGNLRQR